jgi:enoyl-CoA hydratase
MLESFTFAKDGPITTITFNRPERLNCMNREVMVELEGLIKDVRDDRDTRILIITGTGRAFSAGADMSAAKGVTDPAERQRLFNQRNRGVARMVGRSFDQITRLDCTTIAAVNGFAVGGGWALAVAFDFIIAAEEAEFWVPEVELGVAFTGGPAVAMAAKLGPWRSKEAMVLCRHYNARELLTLGMVNQVTSAAELMPATHKLAADILKLPQKAVTRTKHFLDGLFIGPRLY